MTDNQTHNAASMLSGRERILSHAEILVHYNNLLIEQCDSWLSAEDGNRNMEQRIREKREAEKNSIRNLKNNP